MHSFAGSGPGAQARDGCSVEVYRALPYLGELDEVLPLLAPTARVLELGCGTGRLSVELGRTGCEVIGVDESAEMLVWVPSSVRTVHSSIETLRLASSFDAVVLASHLINHPDAQTRTAFVACARRHLRAGGCFLLQRHDPQWLRSVETGPLGNVVDFRLAAEAVRRDDDGVVSVTLRYERGNDCWRHSFSARALDEAGIEALLACHAFGATHWIGPRRLWVCAQAQ